MSKMTVIQLLNKIANGEEVPEKINYNGTLYSYNEGIDYENKFNNFLMGNAVCICSEGLNNEVEIIGEPQEHKIPEKLTETTLYGVPILNKKELSNITLTNKRDIVDIKDKINEILDYLEEINE